MNDSEKERFWAKVNKTEACWTWDGNKSGPGYGLFPIAGRRHLAHRLAHELTAGQIPEGMYVDHVCHNRLCVKPAHLRLATPKQNQENRRGAMSNSKTGIRGVTWAKRENKWRATVSHNHRAVHAGFFERIEDAEAAAIAKRNELFTHNDADRAA